MPPRPWVCQQMGPIISPYFRLEPSEHLIFITPPRLPFLAAPFSPPFPVAFSMKELNALRGTPIPAPRSLLVVRLLASVEKVTSSGVLSRTSCSFFIRTDPRLSFCPTRALRSGTKFLGGNAAGLATPPPSLFLPMFLERCRRRETSFFPRLDSLSFSLALQKRFCLDPFLVMTLAVAFAPTPPLFHCSFTPRALIPAFVRPFVLLFVCVDANSCAWLQSALSLPVVSGFGP